MKRVIVVVATLLLTNSLPAPAGDDAALKELFNVLRENRTITEEQHNRLIQALDDDVEVAEKSVEADRKEVEQSPEVAATDRFSMKLGGELMVDSAFYNKDKNDLGDGTEFRRARLKAEGEMFRDWVYELGVDFADGSTEIKDAYIGYDGWSSANIKMGQFKVPFSLDELTSSKYSTFMERALPVAFAPGRNIGIGLHSSWDDLTVAGGLFGEAYDSDTDKEGDEGWGVAGRLTYAPVHKKTRVLHFGAASEYRKTNDDDEVRFLTRPESHVTNVRYANTGKIEDATSTTKYGLETAGVWGPISGQAEYIYTDVNRNSGSEDVNFDGWYAYASWFLTGESRNYKAKNGTFGRVKPQHRFGAWELAGRYSTIDLNDGMVAGGEEDNITIGLNWHINPRIRVMANYIMVDNDDDADDNGDVEGNDDPDILQLRLQGDF